MKRRRPTRSTPRVFNGRGRESDRFHRMAGETRTSLSHLPDPPQRRSVRSEPLPSRERLGRLDRALRRMPDRSPGTLHEQRGGAPGDRGDPDRFRYRPGNRARPRRNIDTGLFRGENVAQREGATRRTKAAGTAAEPTPPRPWTSIVNTQSKSLTSLRQLWLAAGSCCRPHYCTAR